MKILIIYNLPTDKKSADDLDVLTQVKAVNESLKKLGHTTFKLGVNLNLEKFVKKVKEINPDLAFNLVEAVNGVESYMHFIPLILEKLNLLFTGGNSESIFLTTNKILSKKLFDIYKIPTAKWCSVEDDLKEVKLSNRIIIKPVSSDASIGIDDTAVIENPKNLIYELKTRSSKFGECFAEEFIEGREFNISVIESKNGLVVLPIAEIIFKDFPDSKNKIVSYKAKWDENSFEYKNTIRNFNFSKKDTLLLSRLKKLTLFCWKKFNLKSYARVDFRVDQNNKIYVLEINVNPCISPDSGFYSACENYGWTYSQMIDEIISREKNV